MDRLTEHWARTTVRRFRAATTAATSRKSRCAQAKRNYANALKAWEASGEPTSGTTWEALGTADIDGFIYCEL